MGGTRCGKVEARGRARGAREGKGRGGRGGRGRIALAHPRTGPALRQVPGGLDSQPRAPLASPFRMRPRVSLAPRHAWSDRNEPSRATSTSVSTRDLATAACESLPGSRPRPRVPRARAAVKPTESRRDALRGWTPRGDKRGGRAPSAERSPAVEERPLRCSPSSLLRPVEASQQGRCMSAFTKSPPRAVEEAGHVMGRECAPSAPMMGAPVL